MKFARLGVNIDHVATLRQQRGEFYPQVSKAAELSLRAGAAQITIHLREDRRHIQDFDVSEVHEICKQFKVPLNLEMGCSDEMISIACNQKPEWVCLVPEKRQERTTEGGLDVIDNSNFLRLSQACERIKKNSPNTKISLFVEASPRVLERCLKLKADAVEIHTGEYAKDCLAKKDLTKHLEEYRFGRKIIKAAGWGYHAGHGLTQESLKPLLQDKQFEEYNIGHWIIAEAVFMGLEKVIREMLSLVHQYPLEE
jgi:pyridoxine 5-phosphate synthase